MTLSINGFGAFVKQRKLNVLTGAEDTDPAITFFYNGTGAAATVDVDTAVADKVRLTVDAVDTDIALASGGINLAGELADAVNALRTKDRGWWAILHCPRSTPVIVSTTTQLLATAAASAKGEGGLTIPWDTSVIKARRLCLGNPVFSKWLTVPGRTVRALGRQHVRGPIGFPPIDPSTHTVDGSIYRDIARGFRVKIDNLSAMLDGTSVLTSWLVQPFDPFTDDNDPDPLYSRASGVADGDVSTLDETELTADGLIAPANMPVFIEYLSAAALTDAGYLQAQGWFGR